MGIIWKLEGTIKSQVWVSRRIPVLAQKPLPLTSQEFGRAGSQFSWYNLQDIVQNQEGKVDWKGKSPLVMLNRAKLCTCLKIPVNVATPTIRTCEEERNKFFYSLIVISMIVNYFHQKHPQDQGKLLLETMEASSVLSERAITCANDKVCFSVRQPRGGLCKTFQCPSVVLYRLISLPM